MHIVYVCAHPVFAYVWMLEIEVRHLLQLFSTLFWDRISPWSRSLTVWLHHLASKLQQALENSSKLPASLPCNTGVTEVLPTPGFYVGAGDMNSGPNVCMISADQLSHLPSSLNKAQKNGNIKKQANKCNSKLENKSDRQSKDALTWVKTLVFFEKLIFEKDLFLWQWQKILLHF